MVRERWESRSGQGWAVAAFGFGALSLAFSARAALGVASLPRGAHVEIDAIMVLEARDRTKD
jgi:enamine deaminase RidA (YjgF/YER057c/UK114 family)